MAAGGERVIINIDVNSDIAKIVATRKALEDLTDAQNKHNRAVAKGAKGGGGSSGGGGSGSGGSGSRTPGSTPGRRPKPSSVSKASKGRYDGMASEVFAFRKDAAMGIAAYGKILKLVNKLALIELPLMAAALSGISLGFKAGTYFVNMYRAAMSTMASAVGVAFVALTTFMAAQREFISVQSSPAYYKGTATTNDRFVAAGQAMSMFVDNSRLAVVGAKGLNAAFTKLSEVKPITGQTTVAFESLMDVVAGSGGDLEGGSKKLADFLAKMQKTGSVAGASAEGKALGPDFEKILKEASAMGIKTSDEFMKAAASGELGATFAEKYKGTLDALNNTLMGRFKIAVNNIKAQLTDLGGGYLGMASNTVARLEGIVSTTIARLSFVISRWQSQGGFDKIVDFIENGSNSLIELMNKYLGTVPGIFGFFKKTFDSIGNGFDKMQDWLRQFKAAGDVLNDIFFSPVFSQLFENFTGGMNTMSDLIIKNADTIRGFANQIVDTLTAIGRYTDTVKTLFVSAMPLLTFFLKIIETFFKGFTALNKTVITLNTFFKKYFGAGGKAVGAVLSVAALYAAFTIATRFFATLSKMFGKDMKDKHIRANNVYVNGAGVKGGGGGSSGMTRGMPSQMSGKQRMMSRGRQASGLMGGGMGLAAAGGGLSFLGSQAGGYNTAGGSALSSVGNVAMAAGTMQMMAPGMMKAMKGAKLPKGLGGNGGTLGTKGKMGMNGMAGGLAIVGGSMAAGTAIGSQFNDDSIKSRGTAMAAGAAGGAAIGAAIGSMVPVIGTAAGAALGAVVGGISAWANSGKQRKATRQAAEDMMGTYTENINDAFAGGNIDDLLATQKALNADQQKFIQGNADPAYAAQALKKYEEQIKTTNSAIETYVGNVSMSEQMLGVGAEALNELATAAGIDLKTKLLSFRDVIDLVGKTVDDKVRLMNQAWGSLTSGITGGVMSAFDKKAQERTASTALDASQTKILGGGGSDAELENYLKQQVLFNTAKFGEAGGMANAYNNVIEGMSAGGELGKVDQATKDKLTKMLSEFGMDPASVIDGVLKQTFTDSAGNTVTGSDRLKELVGTGKDGKLDMDALTQKLKDDPFLLANLQNAGVQGVGTTQQNAQAMTSQVLNNGSIGGSYQNGTYKPQSGSNTANVTINASVIDGNTIRQIERAVAEALRDKAERGSTGGVDPRIR